MEVYNNPDGYEFDHPCGNVIRKEEKFFYNPYLPDVDSIIVDDIDYCIDCPCFSLDQRTNVGMCQGLEIKIAIGKIILYPIK